tara:strand:+ start:717 stop:854 length:138 start_codon:yes stop_codon:yes gene_type:complete
MNPDQFSMVLLAVVIAVISICWVAQTLKEGRQAVKESKNKEIDSS